MPPASGLKRGPSGSVSQPQPKRKTMAEKAGTEFTGARSNLVAPTPTRNMIKGASLKDMAKPSIVGSRPGSRQLPHTSSVSSRHTSNSSYSSSVGPGSRPPSRGHVRTASSRSVVSKNGRPATSMAIREEEPAKNGMMPPPPPPINGGLAKNSSFSTLPVKKVRKHRSVQNMSSTYEALSTDREASFCNQFSSLSLNGSSREASVVSQGSQAVSVFDTSLPSYPSSISSNVTVRNRGQGLDAHTLAPSGVFDDEPVAPKTPSAKAFQQQLDRVDSAYKATKPQNRGMSTSPIKSPFLTKYSNNTGFVAWDVDERLGTFESEFKAMKDMINTSINGQKTLEEDVAAVRLKAIELEQLRTNLETKKSELQIELDTAEKRIHTLTRDLEDEKRARRNDLEDLTRDHWKDIDEREREFSREKEELERVARRRLEDAKEGLANDFARQLSEAHKAFEELEKLLEEEKRNATTRTEASGKDLELQLAQLEETRRELDRARKGQDDLNALLVRKEARIADLENQVTAGQNALIHLKGDEQKQLDNFRVLSEEKQAALDQAAKALKEAEEAKAKLRKEETRRRKLFEQLQTLKGNIRVMCRIRPGRNETAAAEINTDIGDYDDHIGKMTVMVPSKNYLGDEIFDPKSYDFERVFEPNEDNRAVFEEISQLVQSAMDGQRVCIFCYGQTGSGKTYTMSSGEGAIIPSAIKMIYKEAESLKDAGWSYKMWGSFTEVYNEKLYDLLGRDGTRNQVDLRQDPVSKKYFVDSEPMLLESPGEVANMLETASKNRTVAATKMNRESSRSHSVFTLKLNGVDIEGNSSEGVINLIDLAGSERTKDSQVEGINFTEATSINKSLSTLSTVMMALAESHAHVPYRNSALTKLLESCLGGNCKTLMFVMVSPLMDDIKETISSLDFATTVSKAKTQRSEGPLKAVKTSGAKSAAPKKR